MSEHHHEGHQEMAHSARDHSAGEPAQRHPIAQTEVVDHSAHASHGGRHGAMQHEEGHAGHEQGIRRKAEEQGVTPVPISEF